MFSIVLALRSKLDQIKDSTSESSSEERESMLNLICLRYGITQGYAKEVCDGMETPELSKIAGGSSDVGILDSILGNYRAVPSPCELPEDNLVSEGWVWFVDCSIETFEWHCKWNSEALLTTLQWRSKFCQDYFDDPEFRLMDLLKVRGRQDLMTLVKEYFPDLSFV